MAISNNSTGLRPGVCTSTTRPTNPYEGFHIYETDTDIEYVWNGSAWVVNYVSAASPAFTGTPTAPTATAGTNTTQLATMASKPWNTAWGKVGYVVKTTNTNLTSTLTDISGLSITWTAVSGRLYKASFNSLASSNAAGDVYIDINITDESNNIKQYLRSWVGSTDMRFGICGFLIESGLSGSVTRKIRGDWYGVSASLEAGGAYPTQFIIEDIGPA